MKFLGNSSAAFRLLAMATGRLPPLSRNALVRALEEKVSRQASQMTHE